MEAATSIYSATDDFLQCVYCMFVTKNHQKTRSRCLVHESRLQAFFNDINRWLQNSKIKEKFFVTASVLNGCGKWGNVRKISRPHGGAQSSSKKKTLSILAKNY